MCTSYLRSFAVIQELALWLRSREIGLKYAAANLTVYYMLHFSVLKVTSLSPPYLDYSLLSSFTTPCLYSSEHPSQLVILYL